MAVKTFQDCLDEDLDTFINEKEFAVAVLYNSPLNAIVNKAISGIFTDDVEIESADTNIMTQSVAPVVRVKTKDIPNSKVRPGDFLTIKTIDYIVKEDAPDGTGITTLILKIK